MGYLYSVNKMLKRFDRDLFARRGPDGITRVLQKTRTGDHFIFALTPGFRAQGEPCEMGLEPIYGKLQEISFAQRERVFQEMEKANERYEESRKRERLNSFEDYASELRPILNKQLGNVLTHSMDKSKDPRRLYERTKHGNR